MGRSCKQVVRAGRRSALWIVSVAVWCLGVGGHSGGGDYASSGDSDMRKSPRLGGAI